MEFLNVGSFLSFFLSLYKKELTSRSDNINLTPMACNFDWFHSYMHLPFYVIFAVTLSLYSQDTV